MMLVCLQQRDWPYHQTRPVLGRFKCEASVELRCAYVATSGWPVRRCQMSTRHATSDVPWTAGSAGAASCGRSAGDAGSQQLPF